MVGRSVVRVVIRIAVAVICHATVGCDSGDSPATGGGPKEPAEELPLANVRYALNMDMGWSVRNASHLAICQRMLAEWKTGRAYEKLAIAEGLLRVINSGGECEKLDEYTWQPGTDDLRLPRARAKWGLERLLDVRLPGTITRNSPMHELARIEGQAASVVEAYRLGMMLRSKESVVSVQRLKQLKDKYRGKLVTGGSTEAQESGGMMRDLLGEWPPIGRQYEDLVSIIGIRGEPYDGSMYYYRFVGDFTGTHYYFTVRDGIIVSVGMLTGD